MSKREKPIRRTSVGGQALIEGIMMLGPKTGAMAVRTKDQSIYTEEWEIPEKKWYQKCPFVRGVFNFVAQLRTGSKYLNKSMEYLSSFRFSPKRSSHPEYPNCCFRGLPLPPRSLRWRALFIFLPFHNFP